MNRYLIFFFAVLCLSFTSCTAITEYYLANTTEQPLFVTLVWNDPTMEKEQSVFSSGPILKDMGDHGYLKFSQRVQTDSFGQETSFVLPAGNMVYLGNSHHYSTGAQKIIIKGNNFLLEMSSKNFGQHFKNRDNFFGPIQAVCEIK